MLRSFSKLQQPLKGVASTMCKEYGVLARPKVRDVQSDGDAVYIRQNPAEQTPKYETYVVYKTETPHELHVNVEGLNKELQTVFVEAYLNTIKKLIDVNEIKRISFNHVNEDVFRRQLNMTIRTLGFTSSFQRYNADRGLAVFNVKSKKIDDVDSRRIGSYHRMAYTKSRKTDILNLVS